MHQRFLGLGGQSVLKARRVLVFLLLGVPLIRADASQPGPPGVVSARAGLVTFKEGNPSVTTNSKKSSAVRRLAAGDRLQTRDGDRVEVALQPGNYLRLDYNTQVEFRTTTFDKTQLRLIEGTIVVDIPVLDRKIHSLTVSTPCGDFRVLKTGWCRFRMIDPQTIELRLHKGSWVWMTGEEPISTLTAGECYTLKVKNIPPLRRTSLKPKEEDDFDRWCRRRSKEVRSFPVRKLDFGRWHGPGAH